MADTTKVTNSLSIEAKAYYYDKTTGQLDETKSKTVTIKIPNPKNDMITENNIKTYGARFLNPTANSAIYILESDEGEYHFHDSSTSKDINTAYTTNQTVIGVDIGYSD